MASKYLVEHRSSLTVELTFERYEWKQKKPLGNQELL